MTAPPPHSPRPRSRMWSQGRQDELPARKQMYYVTNKPKRRHRHTGVRNNNESTESHHRVTCGHAPGGTGSHALGGDRRPRPGGEIGGHAPGGEIGGHAPGGTGGHAPGGDRRPRPWGEQVSQAEEGSGTQLCHRQEDGGLLSGHLGGGGTPDSQAHGSLPLPRGPPSPHGHCTPCFLGQMLSSAGRLLPQGHGAVVCPLGACRLVLQL